jgi:hypothetical protein
MRGTVSGQTSTVHLRKRVLWGSLRKGIGKFRGELVCESCYRYNKDTGAARGLGGMAAPTVPQNQEPDYPWPADRVCENVTCLNVATVDTEKGRLRASYGCWVCQKYYEYELKKKIYRQVGPNGKSYCQ